MIDFSIILKEFLHTQTSAPASTTLNGAIDADDLALTLTSGAAFDSLDGPIVLKLGTELIVGTLSGNTFTVTGGASHNLRGAFRTTAASHSNGATVSAAVLYDVAATRIYDQRMPKDWANDSPAIVWGVLNPQHEFRIPVWSMDADFYCFPATDNEIEVRAFGRLLCDRLNGITMVDTTSGTIMSASVTDGPNALIEDDTEYKRAQVIAQIKMRSR